MIYSIIFEIKKSRNIIGKDGSDHIFKIFEIIKIRNIIEKDGSD